MVSCSHTTMLKTGCASGQRTYIGKRPPGAPRSRSKSDNTPAMDTPAPAPSLPPLAPGLPTPVAERQVQSELEVKPTSRFRFLKKTAASPPPRPVSTALSPPGPISAPISLSSPEPISAPVDSSIPEVPSTPVALLSPGPRHMAVSQSPLVPISAPVAPPLLEVSVLSVWSHCQSNYSIETCGGDGGRRGASSVTPSTALGSCSISP
jgi:hypothetical protein